MRCWSWALFPVLLGILTLKELSILSSLISGRVPAKENNRRWYLVPVYPIIAFLGVWVSDRLRWFCIVRWFKVLLIWIAVIIIILGAVEFIRAI